MGVFVQGTILFTDYYDMLNYGREYKGTFLDGKFHG
jgi:hypothetical protein